MKKNRQLILVTSVLFLVSVVIILNFVLFYKKNNLIEENKVVLSLPVQIKIPSINIDAPIEQVGITSEGAMGVPEGPLEAGWYNLGFRPGEKGTSVIDGHSGWKDGIPAVFDNLHKLQKGDKIYIQDEKGNSFSFVVREIKKYDPSVHARDVFYSSDSQSHLNLITCEGVWNELTKSRSERLVVFTDLVL